MGVDRPELMTRVELTDEITRRAESDPIEQKRARGWLGVARDLVASVVESGLNLPDAAAVIRGERAELELRPPEPVATVTLAEIYAAQGHVDRALAMLEEVIASEPEHEAAGRLRERLLADRGAARRTPRVAPLPDLPASLEVPENLDPTKFEDSLEPPAEAEPTPLAEIGEAALEAAWSDADETELSAIPAPEPAVASESAPESESEPRLASEPAVAPETAPEPALVPEQAEALPPTRSELLAPVLILLRAEGNADPSVCWDLGAEPPAEVPLRVVCIAFASASAGVERSEISFPVTERRGRAVLESVPPLAVVRAALGLEEESGFLPLAIASELEAGPQGVEVRYRPPGASHVALSDVERALVGEFSG